MLRNILLTILTVFILFQISIAQTGWVNVTGFGSNPGNLNMYKYVPGGINGKAPLVLALHGCGENATEYALQTGWDRLADTHGFYMVYPEQNLVNNNSNCFNWFNPGDENRGQGEALSIKQMVDYMTAHYNIDSSRIFITGLSAGGCMTTVMLSCYPDVFNAGAVMAGVPYKAASNIFQSDSIMMGQITKTPQAWGDLARSGYTGYNGPWPRVAVFQGTADAVVNQNNATEIMKQFTNLHATDQTPEITITPFNGNNIVTQNIYNDTSGTPVVETFFINGMQHGIALDTGTCYQKGGIAGPFAWEVHLYSSFWAAYFFGILGNDGIVISGPQSVVINQSGVVYSVAAVNGATYTWVVPQGATITAGQGTNQITVNFGNYSGNVSVSETISGSCAAGPADLYVHLHSVSCVPNHVQFNAYTCSNVPYVFNNHTYTTAGSYADTLFNSGGCDSIVTLQLIVHQAPVVALSWDTMVALGRFSSSSTYCFYYNPDTVVIVGGTPAGGIYSGGDVFLHNGSYVMIANNGYFGLDTITYTVVDTLGCSASAFNTIIVNLCEGVNDVSNGELLGVYPNPSNGNFKVVSSAYQTQNLSMFDITGQLILSRVFDGNMFVDISNYANGIYILQLKGSGINATRRITISK